MASSRNERISLNKVKTLTLRNGQMTKGRRTAPVPQLTCVGGDGQGYYEIDVMRCKNIGSDYDDGDVSWSCSADVPKYFKLGSTDVVCEGYESPDDPYVLKGSCGVEYRLALTDAGYEKYGDALYDNYAKTSRKSSSTGEGPATVIFWAIFIGVLAWIIYSAFTNRGNGRQPPLPTQDALGPPWFGGGGGGDDPPPPYDPYPRGPKPSGNPGGPSGGRHGPQWRPGFWTGLATGMAGTQMANSMGERVGNWARGAAGVGRREESRREEPRREEPRRAQSYRSYSPPRRYSPPAESSAAGSMHSTTGFGQTRRR